MTTKTPDSGKKRRYFAVGAALVLTLLVGLGTGTVLAGEGDAEGTVPAAVAEIADEWYSAWNRADGEAAVSMMAPGGRHYCPGSGADGVSGRELAEFVGKGWTIADIEIVDVATMNSPSDASGESRDHIVATELSVDGHSGYVSVLHLRGPEDSLQVLAHRAFP